MGNLADLPDNNQSQKYFASTEIERTIFGENEVQKQKFDFLHRGCSSTPISKGPKKRLSSPELLNISVIPSKTLKPVVQDVSHMLASAEDLAGSNLSVTTTHTSYQGSNPALAPSIARPASDTFIRNTAQSKQISQADKKVVPGHENSAHRNGIEGGRLCIPEEKMKEEPGKLDNIDPFLQMTREDNEQKIELLNKQQQDELEKVKQTYETKLLEAKENHKKVLEKAMTKAKNEANENVSHLNKQIIHEREKMFSEQKSNNKHLENEFRMKEDRLNKSMIEIEEREQTWQEEKQEVLIEVQRLKAEATQMASVLAIEYDEDNIGEDKKLSLSQEVYSLQLVVDMRTGEVRNLREHLARAIQQLEQAEMGKERLRKATARMEDLEEQLRIKNHMAKQLSQEKSQLEINMTNTKKEVDRMSKNVEALQWRIRNHFDVPLDNLTTETCKQEYQEHQRTSLPTLYSDQQKNCTDWITKHLISIQVPENQSMSTNSYISEESSETTKMVNKNGDEIDILHESTIGIG